MSIMYAKQFRNKSTLLLTHETKVIVLIVKYVLTPKNYQHFWEIKL